MSSKNVRATLVTISLGDVSVPASVVQNKEFAQRLLYTMAVRHWDTRMNGRDLPANRKGVIDAFYGSGTGNTFRYMPCTIVSADVLAHQQTVADKTVLRNRKAEVGEKRG